MSKETRVLVIDPSMANTGFVWGVIENGKFVPQDWSLVKTEKTKNKQIRASSDTVSRAKQVIDEIFAKTEEIKPIITFAETPSGSQSSNGMKSYGLSCAFIALLKPDAIQVTPTEVKKATVGRINASKDDMMKWVETNYPNFPYERNKKGDLIKARMEHICDCIAIAHAGMKTAQYKQIEKFL